MVVKQRAKHIPLSECDRDRPDPGLTDTLYHELHQVALGKVRREYMSQTLQATALVHEAWLRVGGDVQPHWASRAQFFAAAAEAMRRILIDRARRRRAVRHGGGKIRVELDAETQVAVECIVVEAQEEGLLALHEALGDLEKGDPETANLVKMHYFVGMTVAELSGTLGLSKRTTERRLAFARAWLGREIEDAFNKG
jgi:RNA polymerase sigma factor (TIGR02999 family)